MLLPCSIFFQPRGKVPAIDRYLQAWRTMSRFVGQIYNSDSQWETLRIVIQEAEDDRKKLQNVKEDNHELCKTYLDHLNQDLATPDECKSVEYVEKQLRKFRKTWKGYRRRLMVKLLLNL